MSAFFFAFGLHGWRPWEPLPDSGSVYVGATAMTMAAIVMAQVGAGLGWRTARRSVFAAGLLTNRLLLVGIALEVAMIALLVYTPGLQEVFHTAPLGPWNWVFLLLWPPIVFGAEEGRKAVLRRRAARP